MTFKPTIQLNLTSRRSGTQQKSTLAQYSKKCCYAWDAVFQTVQQPKALKFSANTMLLCPHPNLSTSSGTKVSFFFFFPHSLVFYLNLPVLGDTVPLGRQAIAFTSFNLFPPIVLEDFILH